MYFANRLGYPSKHQYHDCSSDDIVNECRFFFDFATLLIIKLLVAAETLYIWVVLFFKISLAIFYLRLLVEPWRRRVVYFVVGFATLVGFGYFVYAVFQCGVPDGDFWEKRITGQCKGDTKPKVMGAAYFHAAVVAITDITLVSVPIPVVLRAKITVHEKYVVGGILTMAGL
jgi:hypothetical protein